MISIIIPSYNQQDYLAEAIESALNQNYQYSYEIVVVDDGSTDNSYEIAREYVEKHPLKMTLISQVNKGLASARNTGLMNSMGNWILPLDADDKLLPDAIQKIEDEINKNPDADVIGLSLQTFGLHEEVVELIPNPKLEDFRTGNRLGYCAAIKKSALLEVGGYNPRMVEGYEDLSLWINLLMRGKKIVTTPEVLWQYRLKTDSMYTEARSKHHDKLLAQINKDFPQAEINF